MENITPGESRRAAWGLVAFMVVLPLQWQQLGSSAFGDVRYFQVGAVVMLIVARPLPRLVRSVYRASPVLWWCLIYATILMTIAGEGNLDPAQRLTYALVGLLTAAILVQALANPAGHRIVVWVGTFTLLVFIAVFSKALRAAHVSPFSAFTEAILQGNSKPLLVGLFHAVFSNGVVQGAPQTLDTKAQARHEIFAALLVASAMGLMGREAAKTPRIIASISAGLSVLLAVVILSRSLLLVIAIAVVAVLGRAALRARFGVAGFLAMVFGLGGVALFGGGLIHLISNHVTADTTSYNVRESAFSLPENEVVHRLLRGGGALDTSTHTFIGDAALRGTAVAGLTAVIVTIIFLRYAFWELRSYDAHPSFPNAVLLMMPALVLVRSFTTGGGLLFQVEWVAFAVMVAARMREQSGTSAPPAVEVKAGTELVSATAQPQSRMAASSLSARAAVAAGSGRR